ncbi:hypothetical protein HYU14_02115 [Candidatus Woesearchaeota archaeon]|nr:hypothetical protein [Candidatus Woesearchaeota archaeon]
MKRYLAVGVILALVLLGGCKTIRELYGLESAPDAETVNLEEIVVQPEEDEETPPEIPQEILDEEQGSNGQEDEIPVPDAPAEEVMEAKKPSKVLIVQETEAVSLQPKVSDPDKDTVKLSYTTPLDERGRWATTYGDQGEYTVTVTASDGQLTTSQEVLIIVNKKEETPTIDNAAPAEGRLQANENSEVAFSIEASDLNKDPLAITWSLDGNEAAKDSSTFTYQLDFDAAGDHEITAAVSDGNAEARKEWQLSVSNVNRKPELEALSDITAKETETITLAPAAVDPDGDSLEFSVDNGKLVQDEDNTFIWETTYDDAGAYTVTVTASDGTDKVSRSITITIENVNRPPVIDDIVLG